MPRVAGKTAAKSPGASGSKRPPAPPPPRNPRLIAERPSKREIQRRQLAKLAGPIGLGVAVLTAGLLMMMISASRDPAGTTGQMRSAMGEAMGPRIAHIVILHRRQTPQALLDAAIGPAVGTPILNYPLEVARQRLLEIPWIEAATVERQLPDTLVIDLTEHDAFAIWQNQGRFVLIDRTGKPLPDVDIANFKQLPLVVGDGAPEAAPQFLDALARQPGIQKLVKAAGRVGGRRWDLYLSNDTRVMLPEGGEDQALARLAALEARDQLFERPLAVIDMREPDQLVLELRDPAPAPDSAGAAASVSAGKTADAKPAGTKPTGAKPTEARVPAAGKGAL